MESTKKTIIKTEYKFVRLNEDNVKDVKNLFIAAKNKKVNLNIFINKYNSSYTGKKTLGYIAYDLAKNPVAFYCIIPCFALFNGNRILIAQAVDALTHPKHQRKGLFNEIVKLVTDLAVKEGIHFVYGVPNDISYKAFIEKFNWEYLGNMSVIEFKIFTFPIILITKLTTPLNRLYQFYIERTLFTFFKVSKIPEYEIFKTESFTVEKSNMYLEYKGYKPKYYLKIGKSVVCISIDNFMKVGEIHLATDQDIHKIIRQIKLLAFVLGINKIVIQNSNSQMLNELFPGRSIKIGLPIIGLNLTKMYPINSFKLSYTDLDTF